MSSWHENPPPLPSGKSGLEGWCYAVGFASLIPFLGVLPALASLVLGFIKIHQGGWKLFILAFLGFGVTGGTAYFSYYQVFLSKDNAVAQGLQKVTEDELTNLVSSLEVYKTANGNYPHSLMDLPRGSGKGRGIVDFLAMRGDLSNPKYYIYDLQAGGQTYFLFSRGLDSEAFTVDDVFPKLDPDLASRAGYRPRPGPVDMAGLQSSPVPESQRPAVSSASNVIVWRTPAEGLRESEQTQKPILYDITAEWCGPCRRLSSDVFENPECAAKINQSFIPVRVLDRRREEGTNPSDIAEIESKYQLEGFPTLIIQSPGKSDFKKQVGYGGREGTMTFLN